MKKGFFIVFMLATGLMLEPERCIGQHHILELKATAKVIGPLITLDDVAALRPPSAALQRKLAGIVLGKAAPPSETKDISQSFVRRQLQRAGLLEVIDAIHGPRIIRVTTAHKDITRLRMKEAVAAAVEQALKKRAVEWQVEDRRLPDKLPVPAASFQLVARPASRTIRPGYNVFVLDAHLGDQVYALGKVSAVVRTFATVAVANRKLGLRERLTGSDLRFEQRETTYLNGEPIRPQDLKHALRTKTTIPEGRIVTDRLVETAPLIWRGEKVRLDIIAGGVLVSTNAVAQEAGYMHDWIRVWNHETRRVLKGIVTGKGSVRVEL